MCLFLLPLSLVWLWCAFFFAPNQNRQSEVCVSRFGCKLRAHTTETLGRCTILCVRRTTQKTIVIISYYSSCIYDFFPIQLQCHLATNSRLFGRLGYPAFCGYAYRDACINLPIDAVQISSNVCDFCIRMQP